jgi:hypothetical protein
MRTLTIPEFNDAAVTLNGTSAVSLSGSIPAAIAIAVVMGLMVTAVCTAARVETGITANRFRFSPKLTSESVEYE